MLSWGQDTRNKRDRRRRFVPDDGRDDEGESPDTGSGRDLVEGGGFGRQYAMACALVSGNGRHEMAGNILRDVKWSVRNEACSQDQRVRDGEDGGPCVRKTSETRPNREVQHGSIIAPRLHASCSALDIKADKLHNQVAQADSRSTNGEDRKQVVVRACSSIGVIGLFVDSQQPGAGMSGGV